MALKKFKPMTAGTRWRIGNAYAEVTTNEPEKSLLESQKNTGGRNTSGRRAMPYLGGGKKNAFTERRVFECAQGSIPRKLENVTIWLLKGPGCALGGL